MIGVFGGWVYWRYGVGSVRGPVWRRAVLAAALWGSTLTVQWAVLQGRFQDLNIHQHRYYSYYLNFHPHSSKALELLLKVLHYIYNEFKYNMSRVPNHILQ